MVGPILTGSSSDIEMCRSIGLVSSILRLKYLCHHDWNILKVFGDLHHFGVPFFCSLAVFPCVSSFTFIIDRNGSANMIIPIQCCELPSGFVDLEPRE